MERGNFGTVEQEYKQWWLGEEKSTKLLENTGIHNMIPFFPKI